MSSEADPWERLDGETARAYAAFRAYRDLGATRSVPRVEGYGAPTLRKWAQKHDWRARAEAWDTECYRIEDAQRLDALREMGENHRRIAGELITAGMRALEGTPELTHYEAARYVDLGTRIERGVLAAPIVPTPASAETSEDVSPLERIARELADTA